MLQFNHNQVHGEVFVLMIRVCCYLYSVYTTVAVKTSMMVILTTKPILKDFEVKSMCRKMQTWLL